MNQSYLKLNYNLNSISYASKIEFIGNKLEYLTFYIYNVKNITYVSNNNYTLNIILHNLYCVTIEISQCVSVYSKAYIISCQANLTPLQISVECGVIYTGANQVRTQRISTQFYANVNVKPFVKIVRKISKARFDIFLTISTIATAASTHTQLVFSDLICHYNSSKSIPKS